MFTLENTNGYSTAALEQMNIAYELLSTALKLADDDLTAKAQRDRIREEILAAHDNDDLVGFVARRLKQASRQ